jgi:hypothetical protein
MEIDELWTSWHKIAGDPLKKHKVRVLLGWRSIKLKILKLRLVIFRTRLERRWIEMPRNGFVGRHLVSEKEVFDFPEFLIVEDLLRIRSPVVRWGSGLFWI